MQYLSVIALILVTLAQNSAHSHPVCEGAAGGRVRAAYNFIKLAKQDGILTTQDLQHFAQNQGQTDPFMTAERSIYSLDLKTGFGRNFAKMTDAEKRSLARSIDELLQELRILEAKVSESRVQTAQILAPRIIKTFHLQGRWSSYIPLATGVFEGRPVFLGEYLDVNPTNARQIILFDPFHSDSSQHAVPLPAVGPTVRHNNPQFFYRDGKTYALVIDGPLLYDLAKRASVPLEEIKMGGRDQYHGLRAAIHTVNGSAVGIALADPERGSRAIPYYSFSQPDPRDVYPEGLNSVTSASIGGDLWIAGYSVYGKGLVVINVTKKMTKTLKGNFNSVQPPLIFEKNGKAQIALRKYDPLVSMSGKVYIYDPETDIATPYGSIHKLPNTISYSVIEGVPYIHYLGENTYVFLNLQTGQERTMDGLAPSIPRTDLFTWQNRTYWISAAKGSLLVGEWQSDISFRSVAIPFVNEVRVFTYQGNLYAMVSPAFAMPHLIQLNVTDGRP